MRRCLLPPLLLLLCTLLPAAAAAGSPVVHKTVTINANQLRSPPTLDRPPPGYRLTAQQVLATAQRVPKEAAAARHHPHSFANAYEKGLRNWQVSLFDAKKHEIAQVTIADSTGKVLEAWDGFQVPWTMARGYEGAFGRKVNALYIWLPLSLLFVLPFIDPRRPLRVLHLDLLMLSFFSVSLAFFNHAEIGASVPLSYPPMLYLLGRMGWIGLRRGAPPRPLRLLVPVSWLAVGLVFLVGFRVGLNVTDSNVIDVGYASVVGANQITSGKQVYKHFPKDVSQGDTYGPVTYEAYVPFSQLLGFSGRWDDLPAAHGASIFFDLMAIGLLFLIGRRLRGPPLGWVLAYAWAAFPFTLFTLESNANDSLVAVFVLLAILLASSAPARGIAAALAGLSKFAPLALGPLLLSHGAGGVRRRMLFILGFAVAAALALAPTLIHGGSPQTIYDRTIGYQAGRGSPFSVWGLYGGLDWAQAAVQIATVALALLLAVLPRRDDRVGLAALSAALLIMLQLGITHWFYLYIVWFYGAAVVALFAQGPVLSRWERPAAIARFPAPPPRLERSEPVLP